MEPFNDVTDERSFFQFSCRTKSAMDGNYLRLLDGVDSEINKQKCAPISYTDPHRIPRMNFNMNPDSSPNIIHGDIVNLLFSFFAQAIVHL